ncbi:hypothetical protein SprV_0502024400 [Sparganum proliferum]
MSGSKLSSMDSNSSLTLAPCEAESRQEPQKASSSDAQNSRFVELAASTVILSSLILYSGLLTTSVASQHTNRRIQHARDSDGERMNASAMRSDSAMEGRYPDTPYLSSSRADGFAGEAALLDSDMGSLLAKNNYGESNSSHIWTADEATNVSSDSNVHSRTGMFRDGFEGKKNRSSNFTAISGDRHGGEVK